MPFTIVTVSVTLVVAVVVVIVVVDPERDHLGWEGREEKGNDH